jgi:hypothetical protein
LPGQLHFGQHEIAIEKLVNLPGEISVVDPEPALPQSPALGQRPELGEDIRRHGLLNLQAGEAGTLLDRSEQLHAVL